MGKVVASEFITLDGVFQAPGPTGEFEHAGWSFDFDRGDDGDKFKLDELMASDAQLLGRVTYEGFAEAWPSIEDEVGFAEKMNSMPKHVVSATLENPGWTNSSVIKGELGEEVSKLKQQCAGDILIGGSGQLVRGLLADDLIDEIRLMVFPIVLGSGKRLFDGGEPKTLKLTGTEHVGPDGIVILTYQPISVTQGPKREVSP